MNKNEVFNLMEKLSDKAEKKTIRECKKLNIKVWKIENDCQYFTEQAQDIFNKYYNN
jgi:biotin synthase-like enzyme